VKRRRCRIEQMHAAPLLFERAIFRECYEKFLACSSEEGKRNADLRHRDYAADFCLVSRRVLSERQYEIFCSRYLIRLGETECCARLSLLRSELSRECKQIEETLGLTFAGLKPHPLFPPRQYFDRRHTVVADSCQPRDCSLPINRRFPLRVQGA